ncbi:MAG: transcription antitermination factor NusB, partial [Bacteroidales bacterium]
MVSRRILRIKILQLLYAYYKSSGTSVNKAEKELLFSIRKTYDLYHYLLLLIINVTDYALSRIDIAKNKKIPTWEDLHPNTKFVENKLILQLRNNKQLNEFLKNNKLSWVNYPELIRNLFNKIKDSQHYKEYMNNNNRSYEEDKNIITDIFIKDIADFEPLYQNLEEQSIYWNDEVEFVISIILKTIKNFKEDEGENGNIPPLYKNEEDIKFVKRLFRKAILNKEEYRKLIEQYAKNWEIERIAFIDILILQIAIAEVIEFASIPTKVTFNEYLEIA